MSQNEEFLPLGFHSSGKCLECNVATDGACETARELMKEFMGYVVKLAIELETTPSDLGIKSDFPNSLRPETLKTAFEIVSKEVQMINDGTAPDDVRRRFGLEVPK